MILGGLGSLSYALCLFFVTILYTPLTLHNNTTPRHDTLFTPKPAALYIPGILALLTLNALPGLLAKEEDVTPLRIGYLAVPLYLAFAPQVSDSYLWSVSTADLTRSSPSLGGSNTRPKHLPTAHFEERFMFSRYPLSSFTGSCSSSPFGRMHHQRKPSMIVS